MRQKALVLVFIVFLSGCTGWYTTFAKKPSYNCTRDADCVPGQCCHPTSCVPKTKAPNCSQTLCTMDCKPGTMDCGQGRCVCQDGECQAQM